ncbi:MAG: thioredoxin-disulfide reductase [Chloroflexi bacterium]|nr:thioredoxin-disulfide reductase [Chloroflexota bacterium]
MTGDYEIIIIGGGPAGLTAALYVAMSRRRALLLEKALLGGQIVNADRIENFPGFPSGVGGMELAELMQKQAGRFGLESSYTEVTGLAAEDAGYLVIAEDARISARTVIVAGGSEHQKLNVPGEAEFVGKGVSYCATCDANFFRDRTVAMVGGGNAAVTEALYLTRFASRVYLVHRRGELRATRVLQERAFAEPKIVPVLDTVVEQVRGDSAVRELLLHNVRTGTDSPLKVDGVFVAIGFRPNTGYLRGFLDLDPQGQVMTGARLDTNRPGVFAAGDIRSNSGRQAVIAAGDGAAAALFAEEYLRGA